MFWPCCAWFQTMDFSYIFYFLGIWLLFFYTQKFKIKFWWHIMRGVFLVAEFCWIVRNFFLIMQKSRTRFFSMKKLQNKILFPSSTWNRISKANVKFKFLKESFRTLWWNSIGNVYSDLKPDSSIALFRLWFCLEVMS